MYLYITVYEHFKYVYVFVALVVGTNSIKSYILYSVSINMLFHHTFLMLC